MYGQTRILFAMGRDGLLPKIFTRVNPRTQTPVANTIIVTVVICVLAGFVPLGQLAEATSIGTLFAFLLVNVGVMVLRRTRPDLKRSFRRRCSRSRRSSACSSAATCSSASPASRGWSSSAWLLVGFAVYFLYGYRRSLLHTRR